MGGEQQRSTTLEHRGQLILEGCPDYAVLLDHDWSVVYANPTFQQKFCPHGAWEPGSPGGSTGVVAWLSM